MSKMKTLTINGKTFTVVSPTPIASVTVRSDAWVGDSSPYSQVVPLGGITENSQINLTPTVDQIAILYEKDITFVTENAGGTLTVYVFGQKPTNDYTIPADIVEVEHAGPKIYGIPIATPINPNKFGGSGGSGEDCFSPIAKVTQTDDGAVITITDKNDTTEVFIANGRNGYTPQKGIDYDDGRSAYEYAKDGGYTGTEADFAAKLAEEYPDVPEWAMADSKPSYSKSEVGLGNVDNVKQYSASNPPPYPVMSVNGKTGKVQLGAADVGARPSNWMPTAQEVGALPDTYVPPNQTAAQVGADPAGTAAAAVSTHNTSTDSHWDLRLELKAINDRLTAFFDSDNQTLDELSEIVAYITSNKALIDSITTSKVSVADIINNLTTNVANKPLSAAQGVALKGLIDAVSNSLSNYQPKGDYALRSELPTVPTKVSQLQNDKGYLTEHQDISGKLDTDKLPEAVNTALAQAKESGEFDGEKGDPGVTPHIGSNGNWYIGSVDTGVKAQGKDGAAGRGIKSIARTSGNGAAGTTDTYTITYTDNTTSTLTVYNGKNGTNGTSVTVTSVTESTADGGSNVVTFSDGNTLNVKNGSKGNKGDPGTTPQKGIDFWTPADQEAIVQQVITALGTPVFGRVDADNNIILTGELADGTYTLKYEDAAGNLTEIGSIDIGGMGDSGSVELIWADGVKLDKTTGAEGAGAQYAASQMIELVDGYTYTASQKNVNGWTTGGISICYYNASGGYLGYEELWATTDTEQSSVFTPLDGAKSFRVRLFHGSNPLNAEYYSVTYEKTT
jgi:hypothetical protein